MIASELKIYKDTFDLVLMVVDIQSDLPRLYKYTLGNRMTDAALGLIPCIQQANMDREGRKRSLTEYIVRLETLKTLIHIAAERRVIPMKRQAELARLTTLTGRQATAWKNAPAGR